METGITKISVAGFKSISKETALDIKPLTLLAGANSSGKSSFMQPLLLLKQTLEAPYDPGPLLLNGTNVRLTSIEQALTIATKENEKPLHEFSIALQADGYCVTLFFSKQANGLDVACFANSDPEIKFHRAMDSAEIEQKLQAFIKDKNLFSSTDNQSVQWNVYRNRCFLLVQDSSKRVKINITHSEFFSQILVGIIHIPWLRGNPERVYQATGAGPVFPGTFENYTASVVANWVEKKSVQWEQLCRDLFRLGLTSNISIKRLNDTQIEVMLGRMPENGRNSTDMVSIADVGFGVSQTLPVLVALLVAEPGQLVYLEQPEIHLHPRAQRALAEILVDAANRGVKVVAETHSSMLLLAVQTLIAQRKIHPENVALHWFQRNPIGLTEVSTAKLSEKGTFGDWPVDFGEVELEAESDYLEAIAAIRKKR